MNFATPITMIALLFIMWAINYLAPRPLQADPTWVRIIMSINLVNLCVCTPPSDVPERLRVHHGHKFDLQLQWGRLRWLPTKTNTN